MPALPASVARGKDARFGWERGRPVRLSHANTNSEVSPATNQRASRPRSQQTVRDVRLAPINRQGLPNSNGRCSGNGTLFQLSFDPSIGLCQSVFQRDLRLPLEDFTQTRVVAIAAAHALGLGDVIAFADPLAGDLRHDVHQFVDRNHAVLSEIDRLAMIALHQPVDTFDAVIDVAVRTGLLAVAPNFNVVAVIS